MTDIRDALPPVRDQGRRGTCLTIAVNDGHHGVRREAPALSIDYLHYHAATRDEGGINDGLSIDAIREALLEEGHPAEDECPYSTAPRPGDWIPPAPHREIWKRATAAPLPKWGTIHSTIVAGSPVVLVLSITDEFYDPPEGIVGSTNGSPRGSHAVLGVGLHPTENMVLVRNSWGDEWGLGGYAWISLLYIQARCVALITFGDAPQ